MGNLVKYNLQKHDPKDYDDPYEPSLNENHHHTQLVKTIPIWQYHAVNRSDSSRRFLLSERKNVGDGWTFDGPAFLAFSKSAHPEEAVPVWQYHAVQNNGDGWRFFYSTDPNIGNGWIRDEIVWMAPSYGQKLVYQYHCVQSNGDGWRFHYSLNQNVGEGWTYDNVAFYSV